MGQYRQIPAESAVIARERSRKALAKRSAMLKRRFLKALATTDFNIGEAARRAGVSRSVASTWRKTDPDFKQRMENIFEDQKDFAESILMRNMRSRHPITSNTATIFFLKTKAKDRGYIEGQVIEHKGQINHGVLVMPAPPQNPDDWEQAAVAQQTEIALRGIGAPLPSDRSNEDDEESK